MAERKVLRCAVYARKSTEFGLEQDFNSLDAQREACEAYIKSQAHEGWKLLPAKYDDGGISGATLDRAALQTLLADVKARKIDVIVVYKVDRLTRSLADFAKLVELFDAHGVSFVSITQQFNTTTSMGRLTLNVLLSFAQFEREVTAERIRDKIAASRQKGIWMGGSVPLGYYVQDRKLHIEETEAERVRFIFRRYLEMSGVQALKHDLDARGYLTKRKVQSNGKVVGGIPFYQGPLAYLLKNRVYIGECEHKGKSYPGQHSPIIDRELFDAVQAKIAAHAVAHKNARTASNALLIGRIYDDAGNRMSPTTSHKGAIRYRFYISTALTFKSKKTAGSVKRVSAVPIETAVIEALRLRFPRAEGTEQATAAERESTTEQPVMTAERRLLETHVERITVFKASVVIALKPQAKATETEYDGDNAATLVETIVIPFKPKRGKPRRDILRVLDRENDTNSGVRADTRQLLLRGIAKARSWANELADGRTESIEAIAAREEYSPRYIRQMLPLAFLVPNIVMAIMANTIPVDLGVSRLTDGLPYSWNQQRQKLGC
jgi:DNA invertase Pin-like site-specific DNA recombinase